MMLGRIINFHWTMTSIILCSAVANTMGSCLAFAIPPSQYLLKTWASKHSGIKNVKVKSIVTALEDGKPSGVHFKETTVYIPDLQLVRSWATDDNDRKLYFIEKGGSSVAPVAMILLSAHSRDVMKALKDRGVPIQTDEDLAHLKTEEERVKSETESLERRNGKLFWVIGNTSSKESPSPQVWFEKDNFVPSSVIYLSAEVTTQTRSTDVHEFQFENFRFFRDYPFPFNITASKKGTRILTSQLVDCTLNGDPSSFKKIRNSAGENGFTELGNSTSGAVKDLIRQYYDMVR